MTAIECLKMLRKAVLILIVWNIMITGNMIKQYCNEQNEKLNQQICNLEAIPETPPQFEILEVE